MRIFRTLANPAGLSKTQSKNFTNVQIDAVGVGLANAAAPFLPVFLTRLGATSIEVGLLTSMPALTGLLLAIPMGHFLQNQRKIIPWFSAARLGVIMSYALTGLLAFLISGKPLITGVLAIWALATIPQTMLAITFSVVMNAVAGPDHRFDLMTRRWSILGLTTALMVFLIGQFLDRVDFPLNYQIAFLFLSIGGFISYYFSSQIVLPDIQAHFDGPRLKINEILNQYITLVRKEKPFQAFVLKRFVVLSGAAMTLPVFPLYLVRELRASDSWIAAISTAQTAIMIIGYFFWTRQSRRSGSRPVLLWTTFGTAFYPILAAMTKEVVLITILAGIYGIFQAGLNLVFFDELMKTVPTKYSSTFVALAQGLQYFSSILAPLVGTVLSDLLGLAPALALGGGVQLVGFTLFLINKPARQLPIASDAA